MISIASPLLTAVLTTISGALVGELADWQVLDGIDPQQSYLTKSLTVGGRWDPDLSELTPQEAVLLETTESGAGRRVTETASVDCVAYSGGGDYDFPTHRAAVNQAIAAVGTALRDIRSIDGAAAHARMSAQQWAQVLDQNGAGAMAMFTITVQALP